MREFEEEKYKNLWSAVLQQAIQDSTIDITHKIADRKKNVERLKAYLDVKEWVGSPDFESVCLLAGEDIDIVKEKIHKNLIH